LTDEPNQVFTRDIGFVVSNILFISKMTDPTRKLETKKLVHYIKKMNIDNIHFMENEIEGGDVLVHDKMIFIGLGERTTPRAINELKEVLLRHNLNYEIIEVIINKSLIHLDCTFNILESDTCIISKGVYNPEVVIDRFENIINVPDAEVSSLASNIVCLGNKNVLCSNENFSSILNNHGYVTTYVPFTEIIKAQGSLGCCILPTRRQH